MIHTRNLIAACIELGQKAAEIVKNVYTGGQLDISDKGLDGPCTAADKMSEKMIVSSLNSIYPGLKIIGE